MSTSDNESAFDNCFHPPVPCLVDENDECKYRLWGTAFEDADERIVKTPVILELLAAGCPKSRTVMACNHEGHGMDNVPTILKACEALRQNIEQLVGPDISVCPQCAPGTNTFVFGGSQYTGSCVRVAINMDGQSIQSDDNVLCIGEGGNLSYRGEGEFIAVSHVCEHGWQGVSEDGICSRVLEMLLGVASKFEVEWIWLDIALVSRAREIRAVTVNAMNRVYSSAAVTLVCDRLLLSMEGGTDREKVLAMALSDWMTRLWTMQKAMLSKNLVFLQQDGCWHAEDILDSILYECNEGAENHWKQVGAILTMFNMIKSSDPPLNRIMYLSGERRTSKTIDMVRAIFPLFNLDWPGADTTLEEGQVILLKHLGIDAYCYAWLYAPVGLPPPWTWAPLISVSGEGTILYPGLPIAQDNRRLYGTWFAVEIELKEKFDEYQTNEESTSKYLARITGTLHNSMTFKTEDGTDIDCSVYHNERELTKWLSTTLLLLRAPVDNVGRAGPLEYYNLVVVDSVSGDEYSMHRVGSVLGDLTIPEFKLREKEIQGVIS